MDDFLMAIKERVLPLALALALALAFVSGSTARAEPTPAPTVATTMNEYQSAMAQYQLDLRTFNELMKAREKLRNSINRTFMTEVLRANANLRKVMGTARHTTAMRSAKTARDVAIMDAITGRDVAITNIPTPPVEPIKPVKPEKVEKMQSPLEPEKHDKKVRSKKAR